MKWENALVRGLYRYLYVFKLTTFGRGLLLFGLLSGMVVAWSVEVLTFYLFLSLFFIGFFAFLVNLAWRTRLEIRMSMPNRVSAGATLHAVVQVRNLGRFPAYDVGASFIELPDGLVDASPESCIPVLAPGQADVLPVAFHAVRRGSYALPPFRAFSMFPLRMTRSGSSRISLGNLVVLPAFAPADGVEVPVSPRYQPGGVALSAHVGESPEYIGNRMFQHGDSIRRIDMRAWARVGVPVVREYQEEYFLRVAVVLDTWVAQPRRFPVRRDGSQLEAAVSLTATLVDALSRGEYLLDIFAAGPELYSFRTGRGVTPFDSVLEILACIDACRSNPFEVVTPALTDELGNISSVLFVLLDWDASRRELVRAASECGCRTRVFLVRQGETTLPPVMDTDTSVSFFAPEDVLKGGFGVL